MYLYPLPKGRDREAQAGFTLAEMLVSIGIIAIAVAGFTSLMTSSGKATRNNDAVQSVGSEMDELSSRLKKIWLIRSYAGDVAAPGYAFTNGDGTPCVANCPGVAINVSRPDPSGIPDADGNVGTIIDVVTVATSCAGVAAGPALSRLQSLNYAAIMQDNCVVCQPGEIPTITLTSQNFSADNRFFPHNGHPNPATFRMNGNLGMSMCFNHGLCANLV